LAWRIGYDWGTAARGNPGVFVMRYLLAAVGLLGVLFGTGSHGQEAAPAARALLDEPAVAPERRDGNRLAYLDGPLDPYYPHRDFPKLITPQWIGEDGVECVVTLAIDDMRDSAKYEAFLRPILDRLKQIDGRVPVSIMSCRVDPADPQLQAWLKEGLSIEVHTYDHPCPCLQEGGLAKAKETYDKCVDLMNEIPGNKPVAFRMPCCDSKNTPSPRFWAEVFNKTTAKGNYLQIDSSVFNIITSKDKSLPKEITELPDGTERFRRYVPFTNFVNTIEDYPYPYVIGGMCWEFPCVVPSDWSAQHVQQPNNPDTVRDWKLALDACVLKQGTFNLVFHPHGWIRNDQIVELIDHAVAKHGKKVKFLTFGECAERLNENVLGGIPLSHLADEDYAKIDRSLVSTDLPRYARLVARPTLVDMNGDGYMDVRYASNLMKLRARAWLADQKRWRDKISDADEHLELASLDVEEGVIFSEWHVDIDGDGRPESINRSDNPPVHASLPDGQEVRFDFPHNIRPGNHDSRVKLVDINGDGKLDCLYSDDERYSLHLFKDMKEGWSIKVIDGVRGRTEGNIGPEIPPFVRADGTNNGAWFHSGALWLQNEDTWRLPDNVFKLTFAEMLGKKEPGDGGPGTGKQTGVPRPAVREGAVVSGQLSVGREAKSVLRSVSQVSAPASSPTETPKIEMTRPLTPAESLEALTIRPGFKIELVAAEPLVVDPVAFDWGPDGRLWVVEMRDYPSGITWRKEGDEFGVPGGRVKVLTDKDGDGKYDEAKVFLDKLPFPTGVKVWRNGILVTAAPDILYAEDIDGDSVADVQKVLYRGFGEGNQQHRVNGLRWGLDNWLYVGNGDSGGIIKTLAPLDPHPSPLPEGEGAKEVNVSGRDLRIRPDTGALETIAGQTQFGREQDDWGNWFGGNNSDPMWHYTLDERYLRRNPHVAPPPNKRQVSVSPGAAPVYPRSVTLARFNDANKANRFTSACSQIVYRDDLLGPEFAGNSFVCEPVHNLVHRELMSAAGTTFTSRPDEVGSEFLASTDSWFRPSMCRTGPDGALWVSDMYRFVVEHPKWIPEEFLKHLEVRAGEDKGRIYRIYPEGTPPRPIARLDKLDTAGLVAALDSPNGPQRDLAQQMLLWRADAAAKEPLVKLAHESSRPQARLHALCTLDGLGGLTEELLLAALADPHPGVRRHAVRLSEPQLSASGKLIQVVMRMAGDDDPQVRMQVAYSLGESECNSCGTRLGQILLENAGDAYLVAAALSSIKKDNIGAALAHVLSADSGEPPAVIVDKLLGIAAGLGSDEAMRTAIDAAINPSAGGIKLWQLAAVGRLLDELDRRKIKLDTLVGGDGAVSLESLFAAARRLAQGEETAAGQDITYRTAAIRLLGRGLSGKDDDRELLVGLLAPQQPSAIQSAALAALARIEPDQFAALALAGWPAHTPALRGQILDTLVSREPWSLALLAAIEEGKIPASQVDARRRQQFVASRSEAVRTRAEKVLAAKVTSDRQKLVEEYLASTAAHQADAVHGKEVFTKRCANCHRLDGEGHSVGPDLAALSDRSAGAMFVAVLDPNRAVEDKYLDYLVRLDDGRVVGGMLREETATSISLAAAEGKLTTILRGEIEELRASGKSLMPEGIEKDISPAELADVAAYLRASAPPPKKLAGNEPEVVRPFVDGSIRLLATNARVYGPTVVLEEKYRNLGYWHSIEDHAAWTFETPAEGEYRVVLDYACESGAAGNSVRVTVAGQTLGGVVAGTGTWDDYRGKDLGTVRLPAGAGELVIQSDGPINGALLDLRGVRLSPVKR
jgi:putative membrane-bound dehydrogenase-like protein